MPVINKNGGPVKPMTAEKPLENVIKKANPVNPAPVKPVGTPVVPTLNKPTGTPVVPKPTAPNHPVGASVVPNAPSSVKNLDDVVADVIKGKYGNGAERRAALEKAGYDADKVQAKVNEVLAGEEKALEEVARDVIKGKYGNGAERKAGLEKAGFDPVKVQAKVNELLK